MTEPADPRATFATALVDRGFRLQEVCSVLAIDPARALELLMDPETAAHLKRLVETGHAAHSIPDARRVLESHAYTASMEIPDFINACRAADIDPAKQSIPAFLKAKVHATQMYQKLAHPSLLELFAEAVRIAKSRGLRPDHAALRKQIAEAVQTIIEGKVKAEPDNEAISRWWAAAPHDEVERLNKITRLAAAALAWASTQGPTEELARAVVQSKAVENGFMAMHTEADLSGSFVSLTAAGRALLQVKTSD